MMKNFLKLVCLSIALANPCFASAMDDDPLSLSFQFDAIKEPTELSATCAKKYAFVLKPQTDFHLKIKKVSILTALAQDSIEKNLPNTALLFFTHLLSEGNAGPDTLLPLAFLLEDMGQKQDAAAIYSVGAIENTSFQSRAVIISSEGILKTKTTVDPFADLENELILMFIKASARLHDLKAEGIVVPTGKHEIILKFFPGYKDSPVSLSEDEKEPISQDEGEGPAERKGSPQGAWTETFTLSSGKTITHTPYGIAYGTSFENKVTLPADDKDDSKGCTLKTKMSREAFIKELIDSGLYTEESEDPQNSDS